MCKLVKLASFFDLNEANIIKGLLESEGIEARIFDRHAAGYAPFVIGGVRLMVRQDDLARARDLLRTSHWANGELDEELKEFGHEPGEGPDEFGDDPGEGHDGGLYNGPDDEPDDGPDDGPDYGPDYGKDK